MITSLPIDILPFIINNLHFKDIYNLFYVSKDIQQMYSSEFKGKYYHNFLMKLVNNNYEKFKNELHYVKDGLTCRHFKYEIIIKTPNYLNILQ